MPQRRTILIAATLALAVALTGLSPAAASVRTARAKMLHFVNDFRRANGRHLLTESSDVDGMAQHHSRLMASERLLFHSASLQTKLRAQDPTAWGENIGMGPTVWWVFKAWVHSSTHRSIMLGTAYRRAGIGVVRSGGSLWITMIFYG